MQRRKRVPTILRHLLSGGALLLAACAGTSAPGEPAPPPDTQQGTGGFQSEAVFSDYFPLSGNSELLRRMLSPLATAQLRKALAASGKALREQQIDLSAERFALYVPPRPPPQGYALLVFVAPWQPAKLPQGWAETLDQYGMIFVSAARSGNDESSLGRREPLALLAAHNVMQRYAVDPRRLYVAGFSGGSRVAQRLALGYPDLFRGALLDAGSDPIGDEEHPLPPAELFRLFQERSRLVYVSGGQDSLNVHSDAVSADSMRDWCVFDTEVQTIEPLVGQQAGHEAADPEAFARAVRALLAPVAPDPDRLAACRTGIDREMTEQLDRAAAVLAAGKSGKALKQVREIDARYGGLAAPRSLELSGQAGGGS